MVLQAPDSCNMTLRRVKSRVRAQVPTRKMLQISGRKAQRKPMGIVFGEPPEFMFADDQVDNEPAFTRQRVLSNDELGSLLHSNLSSTLAAAKAYEARYEVVESQPPSNAEHNEHLQNEDDEPPASLLELAPLYSGQQTKDDNHTASLLATTAMYRPLAIHMRLASPRAVPIEHEFHDDREPEVLPVVAEKVTISGDDVFKPAKVHVFLDEMENDEYPASLLPATDVLQPNNCTELGLQTLQPMVPPTDNYAIDDDESSVAGLVDPYASFWHIEPVKRSTTASCKTRSRWTVLQRLVTLFAGRRRCHAVEEQQRDTRTKHQDQSGTVCPSQQPPPPSSRRATFHFQASTPTQPFPAKNLPRSPPILAPQRPYRPIDEHLDALFIKPAEETRYTGTYYVAPDIFTPEEVQQGFPSAEPPASPIDPVHRTNSEAELLDRDKTLWAKWYAKNPTAAHLPFVKANKSQQRREGQQEEEEITDQQLWDTHAARHARYRKAPPPPVTADDVSRQRDAEEHERAARLRYHTGHCFGALTGDVYPFNGGLII